MEGPHGLAQRRPYPSARHRDQREVADAPKVAEPRGAVELEERGGDVPRQLELVRFAKVRLGVVVESFPERHEVLCKVARPTIVGAVGRKEAVGVRWRREGVERAWNGSCLAFALVFGLAAAAAASV